MTRTRRPLLNAIVAGGLALVLAACAGDVPTAPAAVDSATPASLSRVGEHGTQQSALIACPVDTSASASAVIGPRGGRVVVGRFAMFVPPHAVQHATRFTFEVPASQYLEVKISAAGADHYEFRHPVQIVLDYSRCAGAVGNSSDAWYIDSGTHTLLEPMRARNDRRDDLLIFWTDHLSGYALAD